MTIDHLDCPDNLPLRVYLKVGHLPAHLHQPERKLQAPLPCLRKQETDGLSEAEVEAARDKFGMNSFEIPCPTFTELYKAQLMSPVAVFQVPLAHLFLGAVLRVDSFEPSPPNGLRPSCRA